MKSRIDILLVLFTIVVVSVSCKDNFLDANSLSKVNEDFVFSSPAEAYKTLMSEYDLWIDANNDLFYAIDVPGSDITHHPECYSCQVRHVPEYLYAEELDINWAVGQWENLYKVANRANQIMEAIAEKKGYQEAVESNQPNEWSQLYGEAAVFRAYSYFRLMRYWGDVPYFTETIRTASQTDSSRLASRFDIYDSEIAHLQEVAPLMYRLGQGGITAERFSRTFTEALIGKMALYASGYSLLRTDNSVDYGDISFDQWGSTQWDAMYARPSGSKRQNYLQTAKNYLQMVVDNPGSAYLIKNDPRSERFNNPYQYNYQMNMNLQVSPESIYEVGYTKAVYSERPYAFGRPSNGGSSNDYPNKAYGQARIFASFYYGWFSDEDLRRDVTVAVTANSGNNSEVLIDFEPGSREKGGLALNKWDAVRMSNPYTDSQRQSGINWPQMRMADVILMLAEVNAKLGNEAQAKAQLAEVRRRSFKPEDQPAMVDNYVSGLSGEALKDAIMKERALEFAGEGFRRYDLIRTGRFPKAIYDLRQRQADMINGLESQGYYTFDNGNTISNYIWVKMVNVADYGMEHMLTAQTNVEPSDPTYPIKNPGWRGNSDLWTDEGFTASSGKRNMAIKGIDRYIDPDGSEAAALEANGYEKRAWGITIVNNRDQYLTNIFKGYTDGDFNAGVPPRYLLPIPSETIAQSNGLITNGYGFSNQ